eukprot:TRINITY_DN1680_c1_g1_i1.p1 TRINITY_DN1680_c1_g1~~TRINITY_DN1680_c1_g1_i1.p1  ORF type:complete len:147 (-),score=26.28 TRINITY_DN1680_c1_g1_i1:165-569(-)
MTGTQLSTYDHTKHVLLSKGFTDSTHTHLMASIVAGFVCAVVTSPVDVVKTRIMAQIHHRPSSGGGGSLNHIGEGRTTVLYKGSLDCFRKTLANEGWRGFYRGFCASYFRMAMDTTLTLLVLEKTRKMLQLAPL